MKKVSKIIIIISIVVLILLLSYLAITIIGNNTHTPIEFTSEEWNEHIWQREND